MKKHLMYITWLAAAVIISFVLYNAFVGYTHYCYNRGWEAGRAARTIEKFK